MVFILIIVLSFVIAGGAAFWMVGPADRAARRRKATRQFTLTDTITLMVCLQVAIAPAAWVMQQRQGSLGGSTLFTAVVLWVTLWIGAAALWWASVDMMSRAQVVSPLKRVVFVLGVLPLSLAGILGGIALPFSLTAFLLLDDRNRDFPLLWAGAILIWLSIVIATRWVTLWVINQDVSPQPANFDLPESTENRSV